MPKQRKTRKNKLQADTRRNQSAPIQPPTTTPQLGSYTYTPESTPKRTIAAPVRESTTTSIIYQYATYDIRKTAFITLAIVLGQIVVYIIGIHGKLL